MWSRLSPQIGIKNKHVLFRSGHSILLASQESRPVLGAVIQVLLTGPVLVLGTCSIQFPCGR